MAIGNDRKLLQDLELCDLDAVNVSQCFIDHASKFDVYSFYCSNYPRLAANHPLLLRRGGVMRSVLSVCLSVIQCVCEQDNSRDTNAFTHVDQTWYVDTRKG